MKKLLLIWIIIGSFGLMSAQPVIYGTLSPSDLGIGVRIDNFSGWHGSYLAISDGNYKFADDWYINDHMKLSIGYLYYTKTNSFFSVGANYHAYGEVKTPYKMPHRALTPISFEVGCGLYFKRMATAIRIDPVKWDVAIDVGIIF
jgi:hypothetical protein